MSSSEEKPSVVSLSGSPVLHHTQERPFESPKGEECLEQISNHIEAHLGKVATVFHEIVSDTVHIDVHFVKPTADRPFVQLVTSGMSDLPMSLPQGVEASSYAELLMTLPADWRLDPASFEDEIWYWPIRLIKGLARLPHKYDTWLGYGHTVPNGDPAEPYAANTKLSGAILLPCVSAPESFHRLRIHEHKEIAFLSVVPLYAEEMELKLRRGTDELLDRLDNTGVTDVVDPARRNAVRKRFGLF